MNETASVVNGKMPIMRFANLEEAKTCLKYWQRALYLDDWIIKLEIVQHTEMPDAQGSNSVMADLKSCVITLVDIPPEKADKHIVKYCQEATLVHELLHCFDWLQPRNGGTYEQMMFEAMKHQQLEMLSRSLIEVKYQIHKSFWVNT